MGVHTVHSLEDLANERSKRLGERDAYEQCKQPNSRQGEYEDIKREVLTNLARHDRLVVDVGLDPRHQLLYIGRCSHLGWPLVVFAVLPKIFKPMDVSSLSRSAVAGWDISYSSVAFISGHDCGEQNSVMAP